MSLGASWIHAHPAFAMSGSDLALRIAGCLQRTESPYLFTDCMQLYLHENHLSLVLQTCILTMLVVSGDFLAFFGTTK